MLIFTVIIESWTVPGQHAQSFVRRESAEAWLREMFAEWLLPDLREEIEDEDSDVSRIDLHSIADWFDDTAARVVAGTATIDEFCSVIDAVNETKEWAASLEIVENEIDISDQIAAERERIAKALDEEADLSQCAEDAVVVRDCARLVRADFSYEEAERLAEKEGL